MKHSDFPHEDFMSFIAHTSTLLHPLFFTVIIVDCHLSHPLLFLNYYGFGLSNTTSALLHFNFNMLSDNVSHTSIFMFLYAPSANHTNYLLQNHGKLAIASFNFTSCYIYTTIPTIHKNVLPSSVLNFP